MTKQAAFKGAVRQRIAQTGENYTTARRALEAQRGPEPYYRFTPPQTIERVSGEIVKRLPVPDRAGPAFAWGYEGSGPATSAWALLEDATADCDQTLAIEFASDNLSWEQIARESFVITVARSGPGASSASPRSVLGRRGGHTARKSSRSSGGRSAPTAERW